MPDKRIAFATFERMPDVTDDDQLAVAALAARGVEALPAVWDDEAVDWAAFDGVVLRSCWDYHLKAEAFAVWLEGLEALGVPVWNPPDILRWNMEKLYLSDLQELGISVTPSVWLPRGAHVQLTDLLEDKGWGEAVVKPTVSASADNTRRMSLATAKNAQGGMEELLKRGGVVVQPFLDEVKSKGEWSLIFFGKRYSHAVLKRPGDDDFRVQRHLGGSESAGRPPAGLIEQASEILEQVNDPVVYARVDGVEREGRLVLMELELIEPALFFMFDEGAADRFAEEVRKWI
ncbi:MAG: hypothetical protein DWG76_07460 [Chloroflexi bacterium]|nr:hypothetical protein [Chloroflexota bacterium]